MRKMSRRSLILMLALLPLVTVGAILASYPTGSRTQSAGPPQGAAAPQDGMQRKGSRSAEDDATPPALEKGYSEKSNPPADSSSDQRSPAPDTRQTAEPIGEPMLAAVHQTLPDCYRLTPREVA